MDRQQTMWNWVVCCVLTALVVVRAECPENAYQRAMRCTASLGIGPPASGPSQFVESGNVEKAVAACSDGLLTGVVSCLREVTSKCTGNTEREHVLRMMVNPDEIEKSIKYFCANIKIYENNAGCIAESHPNQSACLQEVLNNFRTKAMATENIDVMMTSTCRFHHAAVSCSSTVIKKRCGQQAVDIAMTILKGFQPPKCKNMKFDEGMYPVADDESPSSATRIGLCNFFLPTLALFRYLMTS